LGTGATSELLRVHQEVTTKSRSLDVLWLVACLEDEAPPDGGIQYIASSSKKDLRYGDIYDLKKEIEAVVKANPDIPVFMAGHSYGGWSSMFLTEELPSSVKIRG